jgi:hypothetical protein
MAKARRDRCVIDIVLAAGMGLGAQAAPAVTPASASGTLSVGVTVVAPCGAEGSRGSCAAGTGRRSPAAHSALLQDAAPVAVRTGTDPESGARTLTVVY